MTPQQEQTLRLQARAKGYDKAKEDAYVEFVRSKSAVQTQVSEPAPEKPKGDGFLKSLVKDPVKTLIVKPGTRIAQAGVATYGTIANKPELVERAFQDITVKTPFGDYDIAGQKAGVQGARQIATDTLNSASYLASPAIPKAGPLASITTKVLNRGAKVTAGAATGYASDIASNIEEGKTGKEMFKPKAGALVGAAIPALGAVKDVVKGVKLPKPSGLTQTLTKKAVSELESKYDEIFTGTKAAKKTLVKSTKAGKTPSRFLAERGYIPDVDNGKINSQNVIQKVKQDADSFEEVFSDILSEVDRTLPTGRRINLNHLGQRVKASLNTPSNQASGDMSKIYDEVDNLVSEFKKQFGDSITLTQLNLIKRGQWKQSGVFDATKPRFSSDVNFKFGQAAKNLIEENIPDADIRAFNSFLGDHYDAITNLSKIDGNAVKGGKLGGQFARTIGAIAGSKGGPVGSIVGAMTGDKIAQIMQDNYIATPIKRAILSRIQRDNPLYDQAQKALRSLKYGQKLLPAPKHGTPNKQVNVPMNLPAKTQSTLDAEGKGAGSVFSKVKNAIKDEGGFMRFKSPSRQQAQEEWTKLQKRKVEYLDKGYKESSSVIKNIIRSQKLLEKEMR